MTRKLLVLNLVLVLAVAAAAWRLRQDWLAARAREQALLHRQVKPQPAPPVILSKPIDPVMAASYADIAQKMLFSKDRNPDVVIEARPEPPLKPMPPLPLLYGVMNLPDGATAIMSETGGARHLGVRAGDKVGEFKLLDVSSEDITLEWEGKELVKRVDELIDRSGPQAVSEAPTPRAAAPAAQAQAQAQPTPKGDASPGAELNNRIRACQPGDASPAGTVSNGFRKVVSTTPFGNQCRWEPL